ncbi:hypothetical protein ElyMa_001489400 [Elysia marginata]|uniref:F-box domain-containing protein n=1 Tax=Elysia marginata TaxID=1093978 RepID=A0AAV4J730_9GAST|nr:hypothetical protein ElyMa_001489400 [Elysia marginata]
MSKYFSVRRRFSEPEKPEPRFHWRMRVNTLMMDDGNDSYESSSIQKGDRSHQRVDTPGSSVRAAGAVGTRSAARNIDTPSSLSHRERREKFARTKSEGHLKLRVKFSRTLEDDADSSDASPELNRRRTLPGRSMTLRDFSSHPERRHLSWRNQNWASDDGASQQPEATENNENMATGSVTPQPSESREGVTGGAIPKRFHSKQQAYKSYDSTSSDETDFRRRRSAAKSSSPDSAIGESLPNTQAVSRERSPSVTSQGKTKDSDEEKVSVTGKPVESAEYDSGEDDQSIIGRKKKLDAKLTVTQDASTRRTELSLINDHQSHDFSGTASGLTHYYPLSPKDVASDDVGSGGGGSEDIESIIEKIIAEEEQGGSSPVDNALVSGMQELLGPDSYRFEQELQQLKETIHDCNRETTVAVELSHHKNKMVSSVSLVELNERSASPTLIPCSSSYPPSQVWYHGAKEDTADEEDTSSETEDIISSWANLPMILMEDVLTLLTPKERHLASQVCRQWYDLFYSPRVWETFILLERTLTKKRFNLYKGYQREICPGKTQLCFRRVGSFFKRIVVTPITDYFNLYEFLRILAAFLQGREDSGESAMPLLHTFDFTFACATRGDGGIIIHGTGGQILEMIKELLTRMKGSLRHMKLNQLLLETSEVPSLFHALVHCFSECLHSLEMLNVTKVPMPLEELANFRNIVKLVVSPQHLNDESLLLLSGIGLLQLHIVQDPYTCVCDPVAIEAWKLVREAAPWLRVYLEVTGNTKTQLLIQPRAPVYGIFLRSTHSRLSHGLLMTVVDNYAQTLRYFVQERLPRTHGPRGFEHRSDSALLFLNCVANNFSHERSSFYYAMKAYL